MAYNTEIIAILSSGISFRRMLRPFLIAGAIIGLVSFLLSNFIIPHTNQEMMNFQWKYLKDDRRVENKNIHMQIEKGVQIYVESYTTSRNMARKFAIEKYDGNRLVSRTSSDYAKWMPDDKTWRLSNWKRRDVFEDHEVLTHGAILDTSIALNPKDFIINLEDVKTMDWWDLRAFINKEKLKGSSNVMEYEIEKHERIAFPFANIILTLIGVAISSRKIRGGMGMHLGIGMTLTFTYILFMQISTVFSSNGGLEPVVAVWIPNVVFGIISFFLIRYAPK
jgi:lipopolysaccharide export system permease protein